VTTSHPAQAAIDHSLSPIPLSGADELKLAQRMISYDSSHADGITACVGYLTGWLEARDIDYSTFEVHGLPVVSAKVGAGPVTIVLHSHVDVVPGSEGQFIPYLDREFLWGRGAYDMKGATAAMLAVLADIAPVADALGIAVRFVMVPDEETDEQREEYGTEQLVARGHLGDFVVCGEPTDFHVGIQAKGVLDVRIDVEGRSAHGATPWLGVNAIIKAMDVYDRLTSLPFAQESSAFYERPSINLGRIKGGDRLNQVPDHCTLEVDIRFLPEQPIERLRSELQSLPGCRVSEIAWRPPARVSTRNPFLRLLSTAANSCSPAEVQLVGRDGTNDGVHFLKRGIPSVEFGPLGSGHHGPEEKVSIRSLREYRLALLTFLHMVSKHVDQLTGITVPTQLDGTSRGDARAAFRDG
jgi:succinyl-diaminopimelate desuccinylase